MPSIDFASLALLIVVLLLSLSFHEAAHAWSADRLGDPTARQLGRVTMNPLAHIDPVGTVVFPLIAVVTGLPVLGWAKPVPVDMRNLGADWRQKYMVVAAAGPASNLLLATLAAVLVHTMGYESYGTGATGMFFGFLLTMVEINVLLAVFNMLPVPPLDGGNVLGGLLPTQAAETFDRVRPFGFLILYGLLFTGLLWDILGPVFVFIRDWLL